MKDIVYPPLKSLTAYNTPGKLTSKYVPIKCQKMEKYSWWSTTVWTLKGLLYTCRFLWVNPYGVITSTPWKPHESDHKHHATEKHITAIIPEVSKKQCSQENHHSSECISTLHGRLVKAEGEIKHLKAQIVSQRASWEMRFLELQKRQHDLRHQLQSEITGRSGLVHKASDSEEMSKIFTERGLGNGHHLEEKPYECFSGLNQILRMQHNKGCFNSLTCSWHSFSASVDSRCASDMSETTSLVSWRSGTRPLRAFVPHSAMDLRIGLRVRVLLPSGRISTGTLRYLGQMHGQFDFHLGVELENPDNGKQAGTYKEQCYFDCKPGHGAFVTLNKLVIAWE